MRIRSIVAFIVMGLGAAFAGSSPTQAAVSDPLTFYAEIGWCFSGGAYNDVDVRYTWRSADGDLKATETVRSAAAGNGYWRPSDAVCEAHRIEVGDTIRARIVGSAFVRTFTVPNVTVRFDRVEDVISGRAPADSSIALEVIRCGVFGCFLLEPHMCPDQTVPAGSDGRWRLDVTNCGGTGYDARGGDWAWVTWEGPLGDVVFRATQAPWVRVTLNSPKVEGGTFPGRTTGIRAIRPNGTTRASATLTGSAWGGFSGRLKSAGSPVAPRAGDRISGDWTGTTVSFVMPLVTLDIYPEDDDVSGRCMPNVEYVLRVEDPSGGRSTQSGTTDASGNTAVHDYTGSRDIGPGDVVTLVCIRASGDQVATRIQL